MDPRPPSRETGPFPSPGSALARREDQVARRENTDRLSLADLDGRAAIVALDRRGSDALTTADDHRRCAAANQAAGTAKYRQQDRRAKTRKEVTVNLAAD